MVKLELSLSLTGLLLSRVLKEAPKLFLLGNYGLWLYLLQARV